MRFSVISIARSPRIVPGRCIGRIGGTHERSHDLPRPGRTGHDHDHRGAATDELDQIGVERLADVFFVVPARSVCVDGTQIGRHDAQALALEAADDLSDETAFNGVRLADDKGSLHGRRP